MSYYVVSSWYEKLHQHMLRAVDAKNVLPHVIKYTTADLMLLEFGPVVYDLDEFRTPLPDSVEGFFRGPNSVFATVLKWGPWDYLLYPFA